MANDMQNSVEKDKQSHYYFSEYPSARILKFIPQRTVDNNLGQDHLVD